MQHRDITVWCVHGGSFEMLKLPPTSRYSLTLHIAIERIRSKSVAWHSIELSNVRYRLQPGLHVKHLYLLLCSAIHTQTTDLWCRPLILIHSADTHLAFKTAPTGSIWWHIVHTWKHGIKRPVCSSSNKLNQTDQTSFFATSGVCLFWLLEPCEHWWVWF